MLIVMTYDVWLGIAVVIGAGMGYFMFAALISENFRIRRADSPGFKLVDQTCQNALLADQ